MNVLKIFANVPGNIFNKVAGPKPAALLKRVSNTAFCLWNLRNFPVSTYKTSANDLFWTVQHFWTVPC